MSSMPRTSAASEIVSGLSGFDWATEAGVCDVDALERAQRNARRVEQRRDSRGICHLPGCDERELVEEALRVLHDADHLALDAADSPGGSHRKVERRRDAARHGDLVGARRVVPGDEREHRTAEGSVRVLRTELIGVDRSRDRLRLVLDHLDAAEAVLQARDDARRVRVVGREGHGVLRRAEAGVLRRRVVRRDGRAHDRRRDRDGDEGEDQELLTPLPPEEAPGPADDGPTGRRAAVGGAGVGEAVRGRRCSSRLLRNRAFDRATRGARRGTNRKASGATWSTARPSRRKTTRSAHEARWASWVTTTAATPRLQASRIIRITASPLVESSAPDGSSARRSLRSPTTDASDGHPLALTAGELIGVVPGSIGQPELLERGEPGLVCLACRDAVELEGQRDVLRGGESREEVEVLEDVADRPPTKARLVVARHRSTATPRRCAPRRSSAPRGCRRW